MPKDSTKVVYVALATNLAIAAIKFSVAILSGSAAMLAESFHSTADAGNELLLLIGIKRSLRPVDPQHPFGHGRELYFWALIVAISIFAVGGCHSIYEGTNHILHPQQLGDPTWNYIVLGTVFVFESYSWWIGYRALDRKRERGESLFSAVQKSKDPSVFTVFVEDTADLPSLVIAFLGIFLANTFQLPILDAVASILIGLLLVAAAVLLGHETGGLLVGESADPSTMENVRQIIRADPAVGYLAKALTMQLGPEDVLLVADVSFAPQLGREELEKAVDRIEREIQAKYPLIKHIYFEAESLRQEQRNKAA